MNSIELKLINDQKLESAIGQNLFHQAAVSFGNSKFFHQFLSGKEQNPVSRYASFNAQSNSQMVFAYVHPGVVDKISGEKISGSFSPNSRFNVTG